MKERKRWKVYRRYFLEAEDPEDGIVTEWEFVSTTTAVSEAQAVNNVRFKTVGNWSQYAPIYVSGHWANGFEWKAEVAE